jgi:hypothetical protein
VNCKSPNLCARIQRNSPDFVPPPTQLARSVTSDAKTQPSPVPKKTALHHMAFCARQQSLLEGKRDGRAQKKEESKSTQPAESMLWMLRVLKFSKGHVRQTRATTQKNTIRTHTHAHTAHSKPDHEFFVRCRPACTQRKPDRGARSRVRS